MKILEIALHNDVLTLQPFVYRHGQGVDQPASCQAENNNYSAQLLQGNYSLKSSSTILKLLLLMDHSGKQHFFDLRNISLPEKYR